jgi:hypothetical protein
MKKLITLTILIQALLATNPVMSATGDWEVRRLKDGSCGVKKIKPGAKPGDRVGGPYKSEAKASQDLKRLRSTPRCKRF